ncbi:MAG: hypothetical protein JWM11_5308 [Planctomycetaceae bacterium]|nr:hypothetical protein [Planctomycetaceae bacterium]
MATVSSGPDPFQTRATLLAAAKRGERQSEFRLFYEPLWRNWASFFGSRFQLQLQDREDLVEETWSKVLKGLLKKDVDTDFTSDPNLQKNKNEQTDSSDKSRSEVSHRRGFRLWMRKIMQNAAIDQLRKARRRRELTNLGPTDDGDARSFFESSDNNEFWGHFWEKERLRDLGPAKVCELLADQRNSEESWELLDFLFWQDVRPSDIAKRMNCAPSTVTYHKDRILRILRQKLNGRFDE